MRGTIPSRQARRSSRGFSLVELMVVIGIISLLIGIALPAFSHAKTAAKVATTTATISAIATGLDTFRADERLGGEYPPSQYVNLPHNPQLPPGSPDVNVGGASLAVYALAGADLLGSAGIRDANASDNTAGIAPWANDLTAETSDPVGLYRKDSFGKPVVARTSFVDISKMKLPTWDSINKNFVVPAGKATMLSTAFLDSFDQPILYYRATAGAYGPVVAQPVVSGGRNISAIYNMYDNNNIAFSNAGLDFGAGTKHFENGVAGPRSQPIDILDTTKRETMRKSFMYTIWNPNVTATQVPQPHNAETYILLSAGPDGLYGTEDDVANFPTNK